DVNGDGFDDLIVGAPGVDANGTDAGASYIIFGGQSLGGTVSLGDIGGAVLGLRIDGETQGDGFGNAVSAAGDMNADGIDDVVIGASWNDAGGINSGAAYVVFGDTGLGGVVSASDLADGTQGFRLTGEYAGNRVGFSVSGAGDVDGDGFDNVIVGAYTNGDALPGGGAYVVFGGNFTGAITNEGTAGDDNLVGGAGADALRGGLGNDVLSGAGGDDRLISGAGDDVFVFADGEGADTIVDFGDGDVIDVTGVSGLASFADIAAATSQVDDDAVIDFGGGDSITLIGVNAGALEADDFLA
ncbi:MAG: calcium-binding protein, partial [Alphaproteobacteria bacterium]